MIPLMKSAFSHEKESKEALADFIVSAEKLSMSNQCEAFEKEFAGFQNRKYAVFFNSGGSANLALFQAVKNLGRLKDGAKIGFSALTWSTNIMPAIQLGMEPVAVDCDPFTLNVMSYNLLERLEETSLDALFITNALGFAGDLDKIKNICAEKNILLLEDNCEALGTELPAGKTGNFGVASTFSFFVAHHMSTVEGGMACTDDEELAEMLRIVRANGWDRNLSPESQTKLRQRYGVESEFTAKYTFFDLGFNLRPNEMTGFLGRKQLQYLPDNIKARENNYLELEKSVKFNNELVPLRHNHIKLLSSFAFPVLCSSTGTRSEYVERFHKADVEIRPMIAGNIQEQPFYKKYVGKMYYMPGASKIHDMGFYCGNYPELNPGDIAVIKNCLSGE